METQSTGTESAADKEARRQALARELCALVSIGSIDELRAFGVIAKRVMGVGRESYGPTDLATDKRDFKKEKADEKADWIWYDALEEVRQNDERLERLRAEALAELAPVIATAEANKHDGALPQPSATFDLRDDGSSKLVVHEILPAFDDEPTQERRISKSFDVTDVEGAPC